MFFSCFIDHVRVLLSGDFTWMHLVSKIMPSSVFSQHKWTSGISHTRSCSVRLIWSLNFGFSRNRLPSSWVTECCCRFFRKHRLPAALMQGWRSAAPGGQPAEASGGSQSQKMRSTICSLQKKQKVSFKEESRVHDHKQQLKPKSELIRRLGAKDGLFLT